MGYVKYEITLLLPKGEPAKGAEIRAINRNALVKSSKELKGVTDKDGMFAWEALSTGFNNDTYDFDAKIDVEGLLYVAHWSERVKPNLKIYKKNIVLRTEFLDEMKGIEVSDSIKGQLENDSNSKNIREALRELPFNLKNNCSIASLTLETYILECILKNYIRKKEKWEDNFNELTFGGLIQKVKSLKLLNSGMLNQLEGLNKFRNTAAHDMGVENTTDTAKLGLSLIKQILNLVYEGDL